MGTVLKVGLETDERPKGNVYVFGRLVSGVDCFRVFCFLVVLFVCSLPFLRLLGFRVCSKPVTDKAGNAFGVYVTFT